jgi:aminoglycoside phosphotransferase family enzyme/predicted kinase
MMGLQCVRPHRGQAEAKSRAPSPPADGPGSRRASIEAGLEGQDRLFQALRDPACYPHPVEGPITVIETHISCVFLTGTFAYKLKKAVDLGFVDFTTLEKRRFFCEEELRLNARLAPQLYLDVVPVTGEVGAPRLGAAGEPIDYAVRMREFPQETLADRMLARGRLRAEHIDALARCVARLHEVAAVADPAAGRAAMEAADRHVLENFAQLRALPPDLLQGENLEHSEQWARETQARVREPLAERARVGKVRECHGDLHLGNVVVLDGEPTPFDCIEFNAELRWIDVMNETAFLVMDLHSHERSDLAARFLNAYLEQGGDYEGLRVLLYYQVYRAMVRAKVGLMRAAQLPRESQEARALAERSRRYLALARSFLRPAPGFIVLAHGLSGSGKTTLTQPLLELTGAVRIRSDVERKRMHGLGAGQSARAGAGQGIYSRDASEALHQRLRVMTRTIVESGHRVIVDATFLRHADRQRFARLAAQLGVAFAIVDFSAEPPVLRSRVMARSERGGDASDADLAVLDYQLRTAEPLQPGEREHTFVYDASRPAELAHRADTWAPLWPMLGLQPID